MSETESPIATPKPKRRGTYFLTGLLTVIPLGVTVLVLMFLIRLLADIGRVPAKWLTEYLGEKFKWVAEYLEAPWFINTVSVILVVVIIYAVGVMTSNFLGRRIIILFEWFMHRIPVVKSIYGAVKKLVDLMKQDTGDVQRVVLIDFPSAEMKTVGLVTRTFHDSHSGRKLAAVYVPTTPNPTSGYLEIVPVERIVSTDWTFDEAMQFIVSGGAVAPDRIYYDQSANTQGAQLPPDPDQPDQQSPLPS